jgi:DNA-binding transcriptional regulator YhcF (GntR family)
MTQATAPSARARAHLKAVIAQQLGSGTGRLPTLRQLADAAGVSHVTMLQAIGELRGAGRLTSRRGSGIYLAGATPAKAGQAAPSAPRRPTRWEQAAERLEADVQAGVYPPLSRLPPIKQLCARYGVCGRTLGRCLRRASARLLLTPERRRFRVHAASGSAGRGSVVLISAGDGGSGMPGWDQRHMGHMHGIESNCSQAGLSVRKVFYGYGHPSPGAMRLRAGKGPPYTRQELAGILGFAMLARGLQDLDHRRFVLDLAACGKPVAVLDENGDVITALGTSAPANLRVFSLGHSARPGRISARYLLGLGHRRVAYIGGPQGARWSANRMQGVLEEFAAAGLPDAVAPVALDEQSERLLNEATVTRNTRPNSPVLEEFHGALGSALAPRLRGLLSHDGVTAWVAANDDIGITCLHVLREQKVRVPRQVSVMGFDDSYSALVSDLTSYNFNSSATVQAMLAHIVSPSWPPLRDRPGNVVEIEGFVNTRLTTGRARA